MAGKTSERNEIMEKVLALEKEKTEEENVRKIEQMRRKNELELENLRSCVEHLKDIQNACCQLSSALEELKGITVRQLSEDLLIAVKDVEIERLQHRRDYLIRQERMRDNDNACIVS